MNNKKIWNINDWKNYFQRKLNNGILTIKELNFIDSIARINDLSLIFRDEYELPFLTQDKQYYIKETKLEMIYNLYLFDNELGNRLELFIKQFDKNIKYSLKNFFLNLSGVNLSTNLYWLWNLNRNIFSNNSRINNDQNLKNKSMDEFLYSSYFSDGLSLFSALEWNSQADAISWISKGSQDVFKDIYHVISKFRNNCAHPGKPIYKQKLWNMEQLVYWYTKINGIPNNSQFQQVNNYIDTERLRIDGINYETVRNREEFLVSMLKNSTRINRRLLNTYKNTLNINSININSFFEIRILDLFLLSSQFLINFAPLDINEFKNWIQNKLIELTRDWPVDAKNYLYSKLCELYPLI